MTVTKLTFYDRIDNALSHPEKQLAISAGAKAKYINRANAMAEFQDMEMTRQLARQVRANTLSKLDLYLEQFADNVETLGGKIFWAKDADECNNYIHQLAVRHNVKLIAKSKSMLTEEIDLNDSLGHANIEVVETDLGEFIVQLSNDRPSHIIAPVLHMTREDVGTIFNENLNVPFTTDPSELNTIAREHMRHIFLNADMGISGVNFGVAESGSICLVTNEGNGRLISTTPRIHVAIMGMERIVPTLTDLNTMLQLLARSATGQKLTVYNNIITGPKRTNELDGPDELHIIIIDNGRSNILASSLSEILYCIRCGACLNACPVFQSIGGHAYGSVYPGPVGSILSPLLFGNHFDPLPHASSLCGACKEVCPVDIDLPSLLIKLRTQNIQKGSAPLWMQISQWIYAVTICNPILFQIFLQLAQTITNRFSQKGWITKLPGPLKNWTNQRDFPALAQKSFRQMWSSNKE
ncbi:MAG TPA: iron-sulfur cluster-binding protein [Chloroflexi bacterium]|nr:iron-sulfur cluster-binding protein [Chloroflexota bacterium]HCU99387.1 iron-sulfur cluster-binding protein [Chloroflexota bacterium]|tara:strand:- start:2568 stop:3968 length:1401 start_codon:yes stop_codon:yes gene_type:complete